MPSPPSNRERLPAPRWLIAITLALSAALHLGFGVLIAEVFSAPAIDIEFQIPVDIELGLSQEVAMAAPTPPAPPPPAPASVEPSEPGEGPEKPEKKPKPKPTPDAGVEAKHVGDAGVAKADAGHESDAGPGFGTSAVGTRLPPGAQIALRVNMERIRNSPIADDMRAFLAAIPDWKALLDGSGISPVDQLDRLLIATPDLQREKVVLAGRFVGEQSSVDEAVAKLAAARGRKAVWHPEGSVRVAPWLNADETPRVIALVGPQHFTISRVEDLPRVLAIAAARAKDLRPDAGAIDLPADALLSMDDDEGLSLEVDGVEQFIKRAPRGIPTRLRVAAVEVPGPAISVRSRLVFADAEKAADALRFWDGVRKAYARNALVALLGLSPPLNDAVLELDGAELNVRVELSVEQTRLILGYVRELVTPPQPLPAPPSPTPATRLPSAPAPQKTR